MLLTLVPENGLFSEILKYTLSFVYTLAHGAGVLMLMILERIFPTAKLPASLADPIGYLVILTAFVILVSVARKAAIIIVVVGWLLILLRIVLIVIGVSA